MQPKQAEDPVMSDPTVNEFSKKNMPLENTTQTVKTSSVPMGKPLTFITICMMLLVLGVGIFLTTQFYKNSSKVQALEELTVKNSRQLANLNEMLGRALDANKEDEVVIPPLNLKLSLEFFKHLNELLMQVNDLTFVNTADKISSAKPVVAVSPEATKRTANAEVRWWRSFFNQFLIPLQSYFSELVHVQVIDTPVTELAMTNASQALMKKELTLRLLTIRQLVLNGLSYEASIEMKEIHAITAKNFNVNDDQVKKFITNLDHLITELDRMKDGFQLNQAPLKAK